ncbi:ABC transporter permease [Methyloversatilis thermotolerans]|uniref:ABC transporter permease n=1 Tax=Methyloversatilis thermotolerans TaxID=1346290 RepID=UPI000382889B|nr:ABC transporter permease [Methyloversatilis thermotolerans]
MRLSSSAGEPSSSTTRHLLAWILLAALAVFAFGWPLFAGGDPASQQLLRFLEPPSLQTPLGFDHLGRDMALRLAYAMRLSIGLAMLSVLSAALFGTVAALIAAWQGGWVDRLFGLLADAVLALPALLLVLLFAAFAQGEKWPLYVGLALAAWVEYFRVLRAGARSVLASPAVEASRLLGFGAAYIARVHVLPALWPVASALFCLGVANAILAVAALGFIGVGIRPPTPELGVMMVELLPYYDEAPWLVLSPVVVLALLLLSLVMLTERGGRDSAVRREREA